MTLYALALFVHIVGALLLFTAFTSEGIALFHLRRATSSAQVREWEGVAGIARVVGPASVVTILVSGLYMMISSWGWAPWIVVGFVAWLLVAVMGAVNGIRLSLVARQTQGDSGALTRLAAPSFVISWFTRLAVGLGIVFIMTSKPELFWSILTIAIAMVLGALGGMTVARQGALE